jgi:soluble lytic murein transglycosylase-like protein
MGKRLVCLLILVILSLDVNFTNPYTPLLEQYAKKYKLNPEIVKAVAHVENSKANPKARSSAGAIGIMQVKPIVVREYYRVEKKMDMRLSDATIQSMLKIPEFNILMGCWLLRHMLDRYKQNYIIVLSKYNTGMNYKGMNYKYVNKVMMQTVKK